MFGYPGDGINGIFGALSRAGEKMQFVQARHEEMAAFMATAYAKFTGRLGVGIATSGPGAKHLITGLYDALLDHQPVLAIAGQQARNALGGHYQQELDLVSMFNDVAGAYVEQAPTPAQVRHMIDRAARIALARRTVTAIILPNDLRDEAYEDPPTALCDRALDIADRRWCRWTPMRWLTAFMPLRQGQVRPSRRSAMGHGLDRAIGNRTQLETHE